MKSEQMRNELLHLLNSGPKKFDDLITSLQQFEGRLEPGLRSEVESILASLVDQGLVRKEGSYLVRAQRTKSATVNNR